MLYRKQYKIEVCFKHLKSSGFNLDDLQVEGDHKVDLMFGALSVIYLMAIQKGIVHFEENEILKMNVYKNKNQPNVLYKAPAKSIFKKGCELLFEKVFFLAEFYIELRVCLKFIFHAFKSDILRCISAIYSAIPLLFLKKGASFNTNICLFASENEI